MLLKLLCSKFACGLAWAPTDLAGDSTPPIRTDTAWALATDDVMLFTRTSVQGASRTLQNLDRSFKRMGILKHAAKDVSLASSTTCIGIDVEAGRFLAPHLQSVLKFMAALVHMFRCGDNLLVSPLQLASLLGVAQWHAQLNRPTYSIFDHVYEFARRIPGNVPVQLPAVVMQELLQFLFLLPLLEADLARPWLPQILASDASPVYGFGVSAHRCSSDFARSIGRLAAQPGSYAELDVDSPGKVKRPKVGKPHRIGVHMGQFRTILSLKAQYEAHSGALEAAGITLMLRWLLRTPAHHGTRVAALVDAQAVLAACTKGRSSAPTFKYELRRIAALSLAGGWCMSTCTISRQSCVWSRFERAA